MTPSSEHEERRILAEYRRRESTLPQDYYALHYPANLFSCQGQQRGLLRVLRKSGMLPLAHRRVLDVGCGRGQWLALYDAFDCPQENIAAVELSDERVDTARQRFPKADIRSGNAADLPWDNAAFDIVSQATMFTSILDDEERRQIAREMLRVLKPDGVIVWYDFRFNNPRNAQVRGIGGREIRHLFSGCSVRLERVTLAPPLARRIVPLNWSLARFLESLRFLNTHCLAMIRKRGGATAS